MAFARAEYSPEVLPVGIRQPLGQMSSVALPELVPADVPLP